MTKKQNTRIKHLEQEIKNAIREITEIRRFIDEMPRSYYGTRIYQNSFENLRDWENRLEELEEQKYYIQQSGA